MNAITNRRRAGWNLVGGALLAIVVAAAVLFPGLTPWATPAGATPPPAAAQAQACGVHYYALDAPKESKNAFGPSVPARAEATIKTQLHERRLCGTDKLGDPALTAAHYAGWSATGLTTRKVSFAGIDAFASKLVADQPMWQSVVTEMESLESASAFSLVSVPAGSRSLYMVPTSGAKGVSTRQGFTVGNGTAVVFTHGSAVVKLRLDCGFQNVRASFPGVPSVPPGSPELPKKPVIHKVIIHKVIIPVKVCPPSMPHGTFPVCKDSPSNDPAARGNAPVGGGTNLDPGPGAFIPSTSMVRPPAAPRVNPAPPVVQAPPVGSTPDPAPAPAPEPLAPVPADPATGTSCAPGIPVC